MKGPNPNNSFNFFSHKNPRPDPIDDIQDEKLREETRRNRQHLIDCQNLELETMRADHRSKSKAWAKSLDSFPPDHPMRIAGDIEYDKNQDALDEKFRETVRHHYEDVNRLVEAALAQDRLSHESRSNVRETFDRLRDDNDKGRDR